MSRHSLIAAVAIAGILGASPFSVPGPSRPSKPGGPQPELSSGEQERRRRYNQMKAEEAGRPANYASLPQKRKAKYRRKR